MSFKAGTNVLVRGIVTYGEPDHEDEIRISFKPGSWDYVPVSRIHTTLPVDEPQGIGAVVTVHGQVFTRFSASDERRWAGSDGDATWQFIIGLGDVEILSEGIDL